MSGYVKAKYGKKGGALEKALANRLSGTALKEERMRFALSADVIGREKSQGRYIMLTRPLPMKTVPDDEVWDALNPAWEALHSTNKGSLYDILMTLHARRFRVFPKIGARQAFIAQEAIDKLGLDQAFSDSELSEELPTLACASLYESLTTQVRGKGEKTQAEPLLKRFVMMFGAKPLPKEGESLTFKSHQLLQVLAENLEEAFPTWRVMHERVDEALHIAEVLLNDAGVKVQGLSRISAVYEAIQADQAAAVFRKSTIQYDPQKARITTSDKTLRFYSVCAFYGAEALVQDKAPAKHAQECITTTNGNGLSWLFNDGITLLTDSPLETVAQELGVSLDDPDQREDLDAVIATAKAFQSPTCFGKAAAKNARVTLQGSLDSQITTHLKRLGELYETLSKALPAESVAPVAVEYADYFQNSRLSLPDYNRMLAELNTTREAALKAVTLLLGMSEGEGEGIAYAVEKYNRYQEQLEVLAGSLNGAANESDIAFQAGISALPPLGKNNALVVPDKLVQIHEREINPGKDREQVLERFEALTQGFNTLETALATKYNLSYDQALAQRTKYMTELRKAGGQALPWATPEVLAAREILSKITQAIYRCSDGQLRNDYLALICERGLIPTVTQPNVLKPVPDKGVKRDWTRLVHENKGRLFVNPRSRQRARVVHCDNDVLLQTNLFDLLLQMIQRSGVAPRDKAILYQQYASLRFQGLPDKVNAGDLDQFVYENCTESLRPLLDKGEIDRFVAIKAISSSYLSKLSGLIFQLNKTRFIDTRSFAVWTDVQLCYVPKDTTWRVPETYRAGVLAEALETYGVEADNGGLDVLATSKAILKTLTGKGADEEISDIDALRLKQILRQLPHEWGAVLDVPGWGEKRYCWMMGPNATAKERIVVPISVPHAFSREVDSLLFTQENASPGRVNFERSYRVVDNQVEELTCLRKCALNLPITLGGEPDAGTWKPEYILGIDPGEFGVGLGLVDLDGNEIDRCFVSVPAVRAFVDQLKNHRKKIQPRQKYRAPYHTGLEELKDAATGAMTSLIESLMYQLNAFPVIEMSDKTKQDRVARIVDGLIANFCWGDNDAQNSQRQAHWYGANRWTLPWIKSKTEEQAKGYPGVRVGSYGNSQTCPSCQRNPLQALREMVESDNCKSMTLDANGHLRIKDGALKIMTIDVKGFDAALKRNRFPSYVAAGPDEYKGLSLSSQRYRDLRKALMGSLFRSNPDRNAKQSRESVYHCLYEDCGHVSNSEASAGINIARKFLGLLQG